MLTSYQEPEKPANPPLGRRVGYVLKEGQQALRSAMDDALRELGTTAAQYAALSVLAESQGLSGAELARRCFVTPQTMNDIIVGLEKAQLVTRKAHPVHGRILETSLTDIGRQRLTRADELVSEIERRMLQGLSEIERQMLLDLLKRCAAALSE
jgi:DNA-binding MarR family transcriptional regulator